LGLKGFVDDDDDVIRCLIHFPVESIDYDTFVFFLLFYSSISY